ncbi:MAG: Lrp/AsnC family transcriptional regulator [Firmicutes bacterium]|nr:Lrp/AsnC family transcriptional regulator [Bacillota bacterium]
MSTSREHPQRLNIYPDVQNPVAPVDQCLLNLIQNGLSLVRQPFEEIAGVLELEAADVLARIGCLKEKGFIRRLGGIFDTRALGFTTVLAAARVDPARLEETASLLNAYPGITHNYERTHKYNLWFTLAAGGESALEKLMEEIKEKTGVEDLYPVPSLRRFKLEAKFDLVSEVGPDQRPGPSVSRPAEPGMLPKPRFLPKTGRNPQPCPDPKSGIPHEQRPVDAALTQRPIPIFTPLDQKIIGAMQGDIPLVPEPYHLFAETIGIEGRDFIDALQDYKEKGWLRRVAAVIRHRQAGFSANAMTVWEVPPDRIEEAGMLLATFPQVSHCYERAPFPDFPYNLYAMIHGKRREICEEAASRFAEHTGLDSYVMLYSTREFKKTSMHFFPEPAEIGKLKSQSREEVG